MNYLVWFDMEMTGLNVHENVPIEVAAIVTDWDLKELVTYESVIYQSDSELEKMDDWNKNHHGKSGLLSKIPNGKQLTIVDNELEKIVKTYSKDEPAVLAGNSIFQDRIFVNKYFTNFQTHLHYRMLDVTCLKLIFNNKFGHTYKKTNQHRALEDIRESIAEYIHYLKFISKPNTNSIK